MIGYETRAIRRQEFSAHDAYHERRRRRAMARLPVDEQFSLAQLMSREELFQTSLVLQKHAGDSPGPSGIKLTELARSDLGAMAGALAERIKNGTYWPGPRRSVPIEKPTGGTRTLRIQNIEDKVVARRLKDALEPMIDPKFAEASFGFRPRRGAWQLLARLKTQADRFGHHVLVVCDVRRAFDSVSIEDIMCAFIELLQRTRLRHCSPETRDDLLNLIATVLLGGESGRKVGIDTGCPFSPLTLNVLLHTKHDLLFLEQTRKPFWARDCDGLRYADNLIFPALDGTEGRQALDNLGRHFLGQELPLKEDGRVYDLRSGAKAPTLGFLASFQDGRLAYELPDAAIHRLDEHLDDTHDKPLPAEAAYAALAGWVAWIGPALANGRRLLPQAMRSLISHGYRDVCSWARLLQLWEASCQRWRELLQKEGQREVYVGR